MVVKFASLVVAVVLMFAQGIYSEANLKEHDPRCPDVRALFEATVEEIFEAQACSCIP